jgi:hypothetical protein
MACVKSVQHLTITLDSGTGSDYVTVSGSPDLDNCVPFFTKEQGPDGPSNTSMNQQCINVYFDKPSFSDRVYAARDDSTDADMIVYVTLVEFDPDRTNVYQGTFTTSGTSANPSIGGTVDKDAAFLYFGYTMTGTGPEGGKHTVRGGIDAGETALTFTRQISDGTIAGDWYVVESTSADFDVQEINYDIGDGDFDSFETVASDNIPVTVITTDTFLVGSWYSEFADTGDGHMNWTQRTVLTSGDRVTSTRLSVDWPLHFTVYVVQMADATTVEHGTHTESTDSLPETVTIAEVPTYLTTGWVNGVVSAAHSNATSTNSYFELIPAIQWGMTFDDSTHILLDRGAALSTGETQVVSWEVVDFELTEASSPTRRIMVIS